MVGMFTHVAFQIYLENLQKGKFSGSFFVWYPHYFDGMYGFGGNFAWMGLHLWYLELLFVVSLICLPLFVWLKRTAIGRRVLQGMGNLLANPAAVPLLALPTILLILNLDEATWGNQSLGGWSMFIYPLFYVAGFVILSNERLQKSIVRMRPLHLVMGVILIGAYLFAEFQTGLPISFPFANELTDVLNCLAAWSWLLAIFGFGMAHLNFNTPFLEGRQRGSAALLHLAPDGDYHPGLLCRAVGDSRSAEVSHHPERLIPDRGGRVRVYRAAAQRTALPVRDEAGS